jgi:hypothetical protein
VYVSKNEMYVYAELHKYVKAIIFLATLLCCTTTNGNERCCLPSFFLIGTDFSVSFTSHSVVSYLLFYNRMLYYNVFFSLFGPQIAKLQPVVYYSIYKNLALQII